MKEDHPQHQTLTVEARDACRCTIDEAAIRLPIAWRWIAGAMRTGPRTSPHFWPSRTRHLDRSGLFAQIFDLDCGNAGIAPAARVLRCCSTSQSVLLGCWHDPRPLGEATVVRGFSCFTERKCLAGVRAGLATPSISHDDRRSATISGKMNGSRTTATASSHDERLDASLGRIAEYLSSHDAMSTGACSGGLVRSLSNDMNGFPSENQQGSASDFDRRERALTSGQRPDAEEKEREPS